MRRASRDASGEVADDHVAAYGDARARLTGRTMSATQFTELMLARAERAKTSLNCFTMVTAEEARRAARAADARAARAHGRIRTLEGIAVAIKDCIDTAGVVTTAGSPLWRDRVPTKDASVITRLRHAGAILIGKTNLDEWCYGGPSPLWGAVLNPWGRRWIVGGSSSGSAAAVAAGAATAALGTDAGGSVRYPAAACGVFGLKPTTGSVERDGIAPTVSSLDTVGVLSRDVAGCAAVHAVLSRLRSVAPSARPTVGLEVLDSASLDADVAAALGDARAALARAGCRIVEVELGFVDAANAAHRKISLWEAWQNHGERISRSPDQFAPLVRQRLEVAAKVRPTDHLRACLTRERVRADADHLFGDIDILLGPTLRAPPWSTRRTSFRLDGVSVSPWDFVSRHLAWQNLTGHPALTIPYGVTPDGRPLAVQLTGRHGYDSLLLAVARLLERERPPLCPGFGLPGAG